MTRRDLASSDTREMVDTIKAKAERDGWTRQDLAAASGVNAHTIGKWFSDETRHPHTLTLAKVARALNLRLTLARGN